MSRHISVDWVDKGFESRIDPNPDFPEGQDVDCSEGFMPACRTDLPYPAERCGMFVVSCKRCGQRIAVTTAGRTDDPRSLKMRCLRMM